MKFGIFYEISVPRPWDNETEHRVYHNCIEQAVLADKLGFDHVWAVEHHFLEEYSHCSAPEIFLTAIAARTERIRVGHGINVCVPQMNPAIRIAERSAVLDIVSSGRLDVGTGRSATWTELGGFGANPDTTKATWDEFVRVLPQMWVNERFSYDGVYFSMPERAVLPKPYQKPHPPMWVAVTSPGTEMDAAARGLGALGLTFGSFEEQERKVKAYRERIANCDPVGEFVNDTVASVNFLYCHEDHEQGVETGMRMLGTFGYLAAQLVSAREVYASPSYASFGLLPQVRRQAVAPGTAPAAPPGMCIGNPEDLIKTLKSWEGTGIDCVNFLLNANETVPQEEVLASLELFASQVMPKFKSAEEAA
ncbi:MAG: LLM class flavin-dependent oxidoreductase [Pseudomonadales bacterium]|jgi:alkanesulfonate monooxygenase SsuD/methylene tetrahydromethanopterin reductase-like flavin-dependent oxidoreductase (luciferase family)